MLWLIRMFWLARLAWGCYFTHYVWIGGPLIASLGRMDRMSAWSLIVLFGWGPMLFPLNPSKIVRAAWGWGMSIVLPNGFALLYSMTGVVAPHVLYWLLLPTVAWGPLLFPWLVRARRFWFFWTGPSALRDEAGRKADWTFSDDGLEIAIDFARREFRFRARLAKWREGSGEWNVSSVQMTRPLLDCSLLCEAATRDVYRPTGHHGHGMTPDGQSVSVFVETGGFMSSERTGRYILSVRHRESTRRIAGETVSRRNDGSLSYMGSLRKDDSDLPKSRMSIEMTELPKRVGARLLKSWNSKAVPKIAALQKAAEAEFLAESRAVAEDAFLRDERAVREQWAFAKESARRQIDELCANAEVGSEFLDISYSRDGVVAWAIAADREGRAAIMGGAESWSGSLATARARASVELAESGGGGRPDVFKLLVELDDPKFERERLAKRRFEIMRGKAREKLVEWADRIQILGAQSPIPSPASSPVQIEQAN